MKRHFAKFLIAAATLASCSSPNSASKADSAVSTDPQANTGTSTDTGVDVPVWVNSSALTCNWQSVENETTAGVRCAVKPGEGAPTDVKPTWVVLDSDKAPVTATQHPDDSGTIFDLPAVSIHGYTVQVTMTDGTAQGQVAKPFKELLAGLSDTDKLQSCLDAGVPIDECFTAAGVTLPSGDLLAAATVKKEDSACAHPEMLTRPGAHCDITTEGMAGDLDLAIIYFVNGNDIMGPDGSVKAGDFCDANGIKPRWSKGPIHTEKRWYPYWSTTAHSKPCYHVFKPTNLVDKTNLQHVLFDPAQGVNGEPYCYFVLIQETTTLFGGQLTRMHILKNPKIFKDAANPWLTTDTIKATTEQFMCY